MKYSSYAELTIWQQIMKRLPPNNRIDEAATPVESFWRWGQHEVHIDHYPCDTSPIKVILLHGVGGNGRLLSFIGAPLRRRGYEIISPDLPGYGLTRFHGVPGYPDWVRLAADLISYEREKDGRPIVLFGLSAGGMLAYHSACVDGKVSGIIATNILDQRELVVRDGSATSKTVSRLGTPLLKLLAAVNDSIPLPMRAVANMKAIVNDPGLLSLMLQDKTSSGSSVPLRLILSLVQADPAIEPEEFDICPFLMVHPEDDRWTPLPLSRLFYDRLKCRKHLVMLENAGHFPIESPGIEQLEEAIVEFITGLR
jgi:alpha-beta hydrolase superfamily lysophospholipase